MDGLWFERNAWVENVLMNEIHPDFKSYLKHYTKQKKSDK